MSRAVELWFPENGDTGAIVIDDGGGTPLFALPEAEALQLLAAWWRNGRAKYLRQQEVDRRRRQVRLVAPRESAR